MKKPMSRLTRPPTRQRTKKRRRSRLTTRKSQLRMVKSRKRKTSLLVRSHPETESPKSTLGIHIWRRKTEQPRPLLN